MSTDLDAVLLAAIARHAKRGPRQDLMLAIVLIPVVLFLAFAIVGRMLS